MHPIVRRARETLKRLEGCEERFAADARVRERTAAAIIRRNANAPVIIYKTRENALVQPLPTPDLEDE